MSKRIELWKSKLPDSREARLERYEYSDGSLHWHFRDRLGHPYTPTDEAEVEKIKKDWKLERVDKPYLHYYIFEEHQAGSDKVWEKICGKWREVIITAHTKEEALDIYLRTRELEADRELYFAREVSAYNENQRKLKELGYDSWDDYYNDLYPARPIEI